jgi:hypothetical protein
MGVPRTVIWNPRDFGAVWNGTTDDYDALQRAISMQQTYGGEVELPPGTGYIAHPNGLVPAPGYPNAYTDATRPLLIHGAGMRGSVIKAGSQNVYTGLFGYGDRGVNPKVAQVIASDFTLDGNYSGFGGALPQPTSGAGALVSLPWPYVSAINPKPNGLYHHFTRIHFYRTPGYTFQSTQGIQLEGCEFDHVGQPDVALTGLHYDTLGSGQGDAIVRGCTWHDSSGNYADFVSSTAGDLIRLIFTDNVSRNHQLGGIYACGQGSIITGNRLVNLNPGSGIGYDGGTPAINRSKNLVANNILDNLAVSLVNGQYGDLVVNNI